MANSKCGGTFGTNRMHAPGRLNYYLQMIFSELKGNDNKIKLKHNSTIVGIVRQRRSPCPLAI